MKAVLVSIPLIAIAAALSGCAMLTSWKSIPPPGGCDQCHTVAISTNWQVAYKPVQLNDERNVLAFQTGASTAPAAARQQPDSSLEIRKLQESKCFECHKSPNAAHAGRSGRFHH